MFYFALDGNHEVRQVLNGCHFCRWLALLARYSQLEIAKKKWVLLAFKLYFAATKIDILYVILYFFSNVKMLHKVLSVSLSLYPSSDFSGQTHQQLELLSIS